MNFYKHPIQRHTKEMFDIALDETLYCRVVEDMLNYAGPFLPRKGWLTIKETPTDHEYRVEDVEVEEAKQLSIENMERFPHLTDMLSPWIGTDGRRTDNNQSVIEAARVLLKTLNSEFLLDDLLRSPYVMRWDIKTVCELAFLDQIPLSSSHLKVLEIGGGYGRLSEAVLNGFQGDILYIMADSVPLSLVYSWLFLKKNCSAKRIGFYLDDPVPDLSQYDCYIVPTWHLSKLLQDNQIKLDLAINIQSMQEMSQWHLDTYFKIMNENLASGGYIYLDNNKQYLFQGDWNYPINWKLLLRYNTPFSWSADCPVEIFEKTQHNQSKWNTLVSYGHVFSKEICEQRDKAIAANQTFQVHISKLEEQLKDYSSQIDGLTNQLETRRDQVADLTSQLETRRDQVADLTSQLEARRDQVADLTSQLETRRDQVADLTSQLEARRDQVADLTSQLEARRDQVADLTSQLEARRDQVTALIAQREHYEIAVSNLTAKLEVSCKEADELHNWINGMTNSVSWKITKPLRTIKGLFTTD